MGPSPLDEVILKPTAASEADAPPRQGLGWGMLRRYAALMGWFLRDSAGRDKPRLLGILAAGAASVALQVNAIALAIWYARALQDGQVITVLGRTYDLRQSLAALVGVGAVASLSLLLSGWLYYLSRTMTLRLSRRYEEFCTRRLLEAFGSRSHVPDSADLPPLTDATLMRIARNDVRYCGICLRHVAGLLAPALTAVVAAAVMFSVNVVMSLAILAALGVSLRFMIRANRLGAEHTEALEKKSRPAFEHFRRVLRWQRQTALRKWDGERLQQWLFGDPQVRAWQNAYEGRLRVVAASELISTVFFAAAVLLMFLVLGWGILSGRHGWDLLIIYLLALRYAVTNLKTVATRVTSLNRFYHKVRRYRQTLRLLSTPEPPSAARSESFLVRCERPSLEGSHREWRLSDGGVVGLISPLETDRFDLPLLLEALLGPDRQRVREVLGSAWYVGDVEVCPPVALGELVGADPWPADLERSGLMEKLRPVLEWDRRQSPDPERWRQLPAEVRALLLLLPALRQEVRWVFLADATLQAMDEPTRGALLGLLGGRIVVISAGAATNGLGSYGEEAIVVADAGQVHAIVKREDYPGRRDEVRRLTVQVFRGHHPDRSADAGADLEDEEELV